MRESILSSIYKILLWNKLPEIYYWILLLIRKLNFMRKVNTSHFSKVRKGIIIIIIIIIIIVIIYPLRVFHWVSWWSFTELWVRTSLLKSPGLFSVFWPILMMQLLGWSLLVLLFPSPPVPLIILGDSTKSTNYNRYNCRFHVRQFFQFPSKAQVLILLFSFF